MTDEAKNGSGDSQQDGGATQEGQTAGATSSNQPPLLKDHLSSGETQTIPEHLADSFPTGTRVIKHESGQLVANLPADSGGYHRVIVPAGQSIDRLAADVVTFQQSRNAQPSGE